MSIRIAFELVNMARKETRAELIERLRSEDAVVAVRNALEKSMGRPNGTVDMDRHARAALRAAADMLGRGE